MTPSVALSPVKVVVLVVLLSGCATTENGLPTCDAKHRRPANPHGTVLPGVTAPASQASPRPGPASDPAPPRQPASERQVSAADTLSLATCGGGR